MTMLAEMSFTDARNSFTTLYNEVYNLSEPKIIKRNQREQVMVLRADLQKMVLSTYSLKPQVLPEKDGSITLALDHLEIYVNAETQETAISDFVEELKIYALDYSQRLQLFLNSSNRRSHFPYILRILLCDSDNEILELLEL